MSSIIYDFAIVGAGAAGLNLAMAMLNDPYFENKNILILEKKDKEENDKTWCFWETGNGIWDEIITHQWQKGTFITKDTHTKLDLFPYRYKMIRSVDFYDYTKQQLRSAPQFTYVQDEVKDISMLNQCELTALNGSYKCDHVFDSRIDPEVKEVKEKYLHVLQHFKGWYITTEKEVFNPYSFTMMDFRLKYKDTTSFMYLLPTSKKEALVEFTFFTPELVTEEIYDDLLQTYIKEILKVDDYQIAEVEKGVIPMTSYPFHKKHQEKVTKIGTAGGWVRASSGYSFKNAERNSQKIIDNIKSDKHPADGLHSKKFYFYDSLFLDILVNKNHLGEKIFAAMYEKNDIQQIFRFLDNETSIAEDVALISSLPKKPFLKALMKHFL
ncbi:MAG: lycopene cyclase family protein [Candidatus Cyclobacteriaceae bacterium M2_1C_046]